jgi:hypothetical protein
MHGFSVSLVIHLMTTTWIPTYRIGVHKESLSLSPGLGTGRMLSKTVIILLIYQRHKPIYRINLLES